MSKARAHLFESLWVWAEDTKKTDYTYFRPKYCLEINEKELASVAYDYKVGVIYNKQMQF